MSLKTEILKTPRNTSLIEINTAIRDIKTALLHKYGRDDIEDPVVNSIEISNYVDATIYYKIDTQIMYSYEYCKLVIKKNAIPVNKEDGDKILDVSPYNIKIKVTDLDDSSRYFVKIFVEDTNGTIAMSAAKVFKTGTIYNFDYTGQIQTFVVPETGIYSLETWGAQGGNAEDGNNSARGGYGSYSYGEIALQKGETLYINVGGQNGYGGGGEKIGIIPAELSYITKVNNLNQANVSAYDPALIASFFEHIADGSYFHEATYTRNINGVSITGPRFTYNNSSKFHDDSFESNTSYSSYDYYTAYDAPFNIRVTGDSNGATVEYSNPTALYVDEFLSDFWAAGGMTTHTRRFTLAGDYRDTNNHDLFMIKVTSEGNPDVYKQTSFNSLSDAIEYIYNHYCNINLWVNDERWVFARNSN